MQTPKSALKILTPRGSGHIFNSLSKHKVGESSEEEDLHQQEAVIDEELRSILEISKSLAALLTDNSGDKPVDLEEQLGEDSEVPQASKT